MGAFLLIALSAALTAVRLYMPTVGHSWPMVFIAAAHIFVGMVLTLLWQRRGRWPLGWACLLVPTLLEAAMFFLAAGRCRAPSAAARGRSLAAILAAGIPRPRPGRAWPAGGPVRGRVHAVSPALR
jgi:hypothetical protein